MANATRALLVHLALSLAVVAGTGMVAIGVSGAVAAGLGSIFGTAFVSGDPPGRTYTPERCADLVRFHPEAPDCAAAAAAHHLDEVVEYRLAAGTLGLLLLAALALLRWRYRVWTGQQVLPDSFAATVGASLFGLAAVVLLVPSLLSVGVGHPAGVGKLLSGGLMSLVVFAGYALSLLRTLYAHLS